MKGLIVFDSYFGNTKLVAEAIGEQIRADGHEAVVVSARDGRPWELTADILFVGSPTRLGKPSHRIRKFIKKLEEQRWSSKPMAAFDTYMAGAPNDPIASNFIHERLKEKGLNVRSPPLKCLVTGTKGPLAADALDNAKRYTHEFLLTLGK
jgi:flavodoxin